MSGGHGGQAARTGQRPSTLSAADFGAAFKGFLEQAVAQAPAQEPFFRQRLRAHFGQDPTTLPIVAEEFDPSDHANVQRAVDAFLEGPERTAELLGVLSDQQRYMGLKLTDLLAPARPGLWGGAPPMEGPVEYANVRLHDDQVLPCVKSGLYLVRETAAGAAAGRLAVYLRGPLEQGYPRRVRVEVMAPVRAAAERFLADLRTALRTRNVYRGHVLALSLDEMRQLQVHFRTLPRIAREDIILPAGVLERIERQTIGFARHRAALLRAGRHLKRGLLLHGPPGTGKTLTAMYLASRLRDRTVLLLTGRGLGLIERSCQMARLLQPSMVVLEDVDLVAEERTRPDAACGPLLFELLNEMDGLAEDADVIFLLTTNRPDLLEPALAARPGRVDLAIELPLPDAACRRRLLDLYGRGLILPVADLDGLVRRTEGVSAAFIKELLRKAALFAADEGDERGDSEERDGRFVLARRHLEEALHELLIHGGELTRSLLGARRPAQAAA